METEGITIAFICLGDSHPTLVNYRKFGNKYWDDGKENKSKVGYWFLYYYRQQFVRVHKIIQLLPNTEKPIEMNNWESDRQILCLSPQLKEFTWNEWVTNVGRGAPYAMKYYNTQTRCWVIPELEKSFKDFNFQRFKSILNLESTLESKLESEDYSEEESVTDSIENEDILLVEQINRRIYQKTKDTVHLLREEYVSLSESKIAELNHSIELLVKQRDQEVSHKQEILKGNKDEDIVKRETEIRVQKFIMDYM